MFGGSLSSEMFLIRSMSSMKAEFVSKRWRDQRSGATSPQWRWETPTSVPHKDQQVDSYPWTKTARGEFQNLLETLQRNTGTKTLRIITQQGKEEQCTLPASLLFPRPTLFSAKRECPARKISLRRERKSGVSNQPRQPLGADRKLWWGLKYFWAFIISQTLFLGLYTQLTQSSQLTHCKMPLSQIRILRQAATKHFAQGHEASEWHSWGPTPGHLI